MGVVKLLHQRIRAHKEGNADEYSSASHSIYPGSNNDAASAESAVQDGQESTEYDSTPEGTNTLHGPLVIEKDISHVSFGALTKAHEAIEKRKRSNISHPTPHLQLSPKNRHRLNQGEAQERKAGKKDMREFPRTSKHSPAELSSKKAVSRRREVISITKPDQRDPRFEPLTGRLDEQMTKKNYAFLDAYRASEIASLKIAIRTTKDPAAKEELQRTLLRMESQQKAQRVKDERHIVVRAHRARERELVKQGKRPFFLKRAETKKRALAERFNALGGKQIDRAIERRRRKKASAERKGMPRDRRGKEDKQRGTE